MSSVAETCPHDFLICTLKATHVPSEESSKLAESARYLESLSEQLPELRNG
jgi:hypothetical protein